MQTLFEVYAFYDKFSLPNPHHAVLVTCQTLFMKTQYEPLVEIMRDVAQSQWGKRYQFDIVCLTLLLKAYVGLRNEMGIRWVVEYIVRRQVEVDEEFMRVLRGRVKIRMAGFVPEWTEEGKAVVEECVKICEEVRERSRLLREKRTGLILEVLDERGTVYGNKGGVVEMTTAKAGEIEYGKSLVAAASA